MPIRKPGQITVDCKSVHLLIVIDSVFQITVMDPALLRERELFKKRALAQPTVEKRKIKTDDSSRPNKKPKSAPRPRGINHSSLYSNLTTPG